MSLFQKFMNELGLISPNADLNPEYSQALEKVTATLKEHSPEDAKKIAALALTLARVAAVDSEVSAAELEIIRNIISKFTNLSKEDAVLTAEIASKSSLRDHVEHHICIRILKESFDREQRAQWIRALFQIASDENISIAESDEIQLIARGLGFNHSECIAIRAEFADKLKVLE